MDVEPPAPEVVDEPVIEEVFEPAPEPAPKRAKDVHPPQITHDEPPADMPPPVVPAHAEPEEAVLDPRALKALSRQERREAKSSARREQAEARNAARQAKALAKAAAKAGLPAPAADAAPASDAQVTEAAVEADVVDEIVVEEVADEATAEIPVVADDALEAPEAPTEPPAPTDPRARAAARVARRLGKDAEKLSAAEARTKAREEARARRAQAKELRAGGGVVAEEAVVRKPDEIDASIDEAVEPIGEQTVISEPILDEPVPADTAVIEPVIIEPVSDEPVIDEPVLEEPVIDEPVTDEPEMARPDVSDRIDEPAPVDVAEAVEDADLEDEVAEEQIAEEQVAEEQVAEEPAEPVRIEVQRPSADPVPTTLPMDNDEKPSRASSLAPAAGIIGLISLGISVLLALGALLVALGFDSGGLYNVLQTVANILVGPLNNAFDFQGTNAERKEHFLAWGAGSIGYLVLSFVGQAVQRANADEE